MHTILRRFQPQIAVIHGPTHTRKHSTPSSFNKRSVPLIKKLREVGLNDMWRFIRFTDSPKVIVISLKLCELQVIQVIEQVWLTSPAG